MPLLFPAPPRHLPQLVRHVERTIGPSPMVFHEVVADDIHLDLLLVPPQRSGCSPAFPCGRNFFTIVTAGLSTRPMRLPSYAGASDNVYVELMITLPANWPGLRPDGTLAPDLMNDIRNAWPLQWLKRLAHRIHEEDLLIASGRAFPAPRPLPNNTRLCAMLAAPSMLLPKAQHLAVHDDVVIDFLSLWPIFPEELALAQRQDGKKLMDRLEQAGITDLINLKRQNVAV